jgi:uncharacterized protein
VTYLETSALVKRFVFEAGSGEVRSLLTGDDPIASATIAYVELYSAMTRRHRGRSPHATPVPARVQAL